MDNLHDVLAHDAFFMVNKAVTKKFGLETALLLSFLISWEKHYTIAGKTVDGYFFKSGEAIKDETTLSPHKQRNVFEKLEKAGILDIQLKGVPATNHFKINHAQLLKFLTTGCSKIPQQDVKDFDTIKKTKEKKKEKNNHTPREMAREFFENEKQQASVAKYVVGETGMNYDACRLEITKFVNYWTELNGSGTRKRWEMQKTFELKMRLTTWFRNANNFRGQKVAFRHKNADLDDYNMTKI